MAVEILDPAPGPDNVRRVAAGGADVCLTSVVHYLSAWQGTDALGARFVAVLVQRSPMAALVAADGALCAPRDLPGVRLGGPANSRLVADYQASLGELGLGPSVLVPMDYLEAPVALGRGEIDAVADFVDLIPRTRRLAGIPVRAIPLPLEVYASGLVAADRLPLDLVDRLRRAVVAALEAQRREPRAGLSELKRRYPEIDPAEALEGWALVEPNIFCGIEPGAMEEPRWQRTIAYTAATQSLPGPPLHAVCRPELTMPAMPRRHTDDAVCS